MLIRVGKLRKVQIKRILIQKEPHAKRPGRQGRAKKRMRRKHRSTLILTMLDCLAPVQVADAPGRLVSPVRPSCRAPAPSRLHSPKALRPPLAFSAVSGSSALDGTDAG